MTRKETGSGQRRLVANPDGGTLENAWVHCANPRCRKILFSKEFKRNLKVCKHCGHHATLRAAERVAATADEGSFQELFREVSTADPLTFPEYAGKLGTAARKTGLSEAALIGTARIEGRPVVLGIMDFGFMGGSMGSAVGERMYRAFEHAAREKLPIVLFVCSGGARMQEGLVALMQMAKTSAAVEMVNRAGVPFISVFTNPTMAGVLASFASLGDIILAEPGSKVGFAGERVAAQATVGKPPPDFQTAEFQYRHGMIDRIVPRKDLRRTLSTLLSVLCEE
jgi:acetyl-CoA carboxylase carboxyl transferase subunit beta